MSRYRVDFESGESIDVEADSEREVVAGIVPRAVQIRQIRPLLEIPRAWVFDPDLTPADLGTLARIVALESEPGRAHLTLEELSVGGDRSGNGKAAIRASVNRLIDAGYLSRERYRTSGSRRGVEYRIERTR